MSKKNSRAGGKFGGGHTTVVPAAGVIADIASECVYVTKISVGFIKSGLSTTKGVRRIKIVSSDMSLLISVRDNISHQELRVYTSDIEKAKHAIATGAHEVGFDVVG
ncbi:MAG: hypothetical protein K9M10_03125 [Candidatus Pacebacteria bacterium]|nr:hypothetical protein [Candidatus Paceibacterota bacterium]MCF7857446.1 hypothetical protein [Candidatus Paceibacterota bacterium]